MPFSHRRHRRLPVYSAVAFTRTMTSTTAPFPCRPQCGACCTAPSITSPIPGMPDGKPAGVRCIQLGEDQRCRIFGKPERPAFCGGLQPSHEMCGDSREQAIGWLDELERATAPSTR
jgi:Fe-S-cluster containining protein